MIAGNVKCSTQSLACTSHEAAAFSFPSITVLLRGILLLLQLRTHMQAWSDFKITQRSLAWFQSVSLVMGEGDGGGIAASFPRAWQKRVEGPEWRNRS